MPTLTSIDALVDQIRYTRPEALSRVIIGWSQAAAAAATALSRATIVDRDTGAAFLNNNTEVYDATTATRRARAATGDGGDRFRRVAEAVSVVRDELAGTRTEVLTAREQLRAELTAVETARARLAAAAPTMTQPEVDQQAGVLQARTDQALATASGRITARLDAYNTVLASRTATLANLGYAAEPRPAATGRGTFPNPRDAAGAVITPTLIVIGTALAAIIAALVAAVSRSDGPAPAFPGPTLPTVPAGPSPTLPTAPAAPGPEAAAPAPASSPLPAAPAVTPEERRTGVRETVLNPDGTLPGEPGVSKRVRVADQEQVDHIEQGIRDKLGEPTKVIDKPGKGRIEIWEVAPGERVVVRDFSASGIRGTAGDKTIDIVEVEGLESVEKIHVKPS